MLTAILQEILDWSEVWAPLIPLVLVSFMGKQPRYFIPVIVYLWFALLIGALADAGWKFQVSVKEVTDIYCNNCYSSADLKDEFLQATPAWMYPNTYLYNVHSIGRFICFSIFFYLLSKSFRTKLNKLLLLLVMLFIIINFWFAEEFYSPNSFSSRLFAVECGILLFFCLRWYLYQMQGKGDTEKKSREFWVITGLSIYVVFNFFFFLFYTTLMSQEEYWDFVASMWHFHNITFIILCIFIAKAFYGARDN